MTQFHEGQDVEVWGTLGEWDSCHTWLKAKIVRSLECEECGTLWKVEFPDGTRGIFDAGQIREVQLTFEELPDFSRIG